MGGVDEMDGDDGGGGVGGVSGVGIYGSKPQQRLHDAVLAEVLRQAPL